MSTVASSSSPISKNKTDGQMYSRRNVDSQIPFTESSTINPRDMDFNTHQKDHNYLITDLQIGLIDKPLTIRDGLQVTSLSTEGCPILVELSFDINRDDMNDSFRYARCFTGSSKVPKLLERNREYWLDSWNATASYEELPIPLDVQKALEQAKDDPNIIQESSWKSNICGYLSSQLHEESSTEITHISQVDGKLLYRPKTRLNESTHQFVGLSLIRQPKPFIFDAENTKLDSDQGAWYVLTAWEKEEIDSDSYQNFDLGECDDGEDDDTNNLNGWSMRL
ncbi:uncharacterized protein L201_006533 [Kwoniella dendrophila CBS 6074]|uniref:Uncharacterized protein n=1 Tax=Kwoniella dendrophila CBS 6074 TaxID=1295534 RepID=A0AAX4K411_9TREE